MNFTKNFKMQMVMVALSASLLMTGKVYSQEIVNTDFDTPATSVGNNFNTAEQAAVNTAATSPAIQATNQMDELGASSLPLTAGPLLAIAILLVGFVIVKKVSTTWNKGRNITWSSASRNNALVNRKPYVMHS